MQRNLKMVAGVLIYSLSGCAATHYGPADLGNVGGYTNYSKGADQWEVVFGANDRVTVDYTAHAAIYRAAIIAKSAGFNYINLINFPVWERLYLPHNYSASLKFSGTNNPERGFRCLSKKDFQNNCRTLAVEDVFSAYGLELQQTQTMRDVEIADVQKRGMHCGFTCL